MSPSPNKPAPGNAGIASRKTYGAIARLQSDGTLDTTFPPLNSLQEDGEGLVSSIVIQDQTRALVGGEFHGTYGEPFDLLRIHLREPAPRLSILQGSGGLLHLTYTYSGSYDFAVLSTTNLGLSGSNWTVLGFATNSGAGLYRFTDRVVTSEAHRYCQLRGAGPLWNQGDRTRER